MAIDTTRKELVGHSQVSPTTIYGWPAVFFSLPFMAAGVGIILIGLEMIPVERSKVHVSMPLLASFGGLFFLCGLLVFVHGLQSVWLNAKIRNLQRERPTEIWYADYKWDPKGIKGDSLSQVTTRFYGLIGITLFLLPFHWFAFREVRALPFQLGIGFFDFIMMVFWGYWVYLVLRLLKYGVSSLDFHQFPFLLGDKLSVTMNSSKPIPGLKDMTVILRYVQENYEVRGSGKDRKSVVVSYQVYAASQTIENAGIYQQGSLRIPVTFELPANLEWTTSLSSRPARYWELEAKAQTPGIDYGTAFFVPVYAKS